MKEYSIEGKTAFVTGATSGIGKACAKQFAERGAHVVVLGRREERLKDLAEELSSKYGVKIIPLTVDVQKYEEVQNAFKQLEGIEIEILVNNAGLALSTDKLQEGKVDEWETMIDTNVKGLLYVTREALPAMIKRNRGHIVNIGSVAGYDVYPGGNVYSATKHAVKALSKSLRIDLMGTMIRVSEIDPGAVETEFSEVRWKDKERAKELYKGFTPLCAEDIADGVIYSVTRPLHVNVSELHIFPQAQASVRDLYRPGVAASDLLGGTKK